MRKLVGCPAWLRSCALPMGRASCPACPSSIWDRGRMTFPWTNLITAGRVIRADRTD